MFLLNVKSDLRRGRSCVFLLHAHLVFVTKHRRKVFAKVHFASLRRIFEKVCRDFEVVLVAFDGEGNHVHLLVNYPPKVAIAKLVNSLKGVSSRMIRKYHEDVSAHYYKGVLWSPSYFAGSCGGASIEVMRSYIENQLSPN